MAHRYSAAVCTVSSPSYFHMAKTLMRSVIENGWELDRYVFLVDSSEDLPRYSSELFTTVPLEGLFDSLPLIRLFRYTSTEMALSLKATALQYLLDLDYERAIFLDADTLVLGPVYPILSRLDSHDGVITPHLTEPLCDGYRPDDVEIAKNGSLNAGFIAVKASNEGRRFVDWWNERLVLWCLVETDLGFFGDQLFLDMIPSFFPGILVDRSPGLNVALWNLPHRDIRRKKNGYFFGDTRVTFFHFAGFDPSRPTLLSKLDRRFTIIGIPSTAQELLNAYTGRLIENGFHEFKNSPYRYDYFSDGSTRILPIIRKIYRDYQFIQERFGDNPFDMSRDPGFRTTYNRKLLGGHSPVTLLAHQLYGQTALQRDPFGDLKGLDVRHLAETLVNVIAPEIGLSQAFVDPIRAILQNQSSEASPVPLGKTSIEQGTPFPHDLHPQRQREAGDAEPALESGLTRHPTVLDHLLQASLRATVRAAKRIKRIPRVRRAVGRVLHELIPLTDVDVAPVADLRITKDFGRIAVNVVGWLKADIPTGELARSTIRAASAMDIPVAPVNLSIGCDASMTEIVPEHVTPGVSASRDVNVFHVNGDLFQVTHLELGGEFFAGRYNVAYWDWGMQYLPESWRPHVSSFHEVWTPSTFFLEALGRSVSIPVIRMPYNASPEIPQDIGRRDLGLPEHAFVFLCCTDLLESPERNNPIGCLEAFTRAFDTAQLDVRLCMVIRNARHRPDIMKTMVRYTQCCKRIILLKDGLDRTRMNALLNNCDSFVSLHRSVGFGLEIAAAMYLGKTVIATGWSGNMDYMNVGNSVPVRFDMVEVPGHAEPQAKRHFWAEPDLDHAAEMIKAVVEDRSLRENLGRRAKHDIRTNFSPERTGEMLNQRLEQIRMIL